MKIRLQVQFSSGIEVNFAFFIRRTLATMAIDRGMPIEQVQKLLGHKNINTTMQYATNSPTRIPAEANSSIIAKLRISVQVSRKISNVSAAKRVEGCSEKTVIYYTATINKFLDSTNKDIRDILTDDIRIYLSDYQEKNSSSKVTMDNMRLYRKRYRNVH